MDKPKRLMFLISIISILLQACGIPTPQINPQMTETNVIPTLENTPERPVVITPGIKENIVHLNAGGTFEVQIPTIPKSGYEWVPKDLDTNMLLQEGMAVYTPDSAPNSAGGIVSLKFRATSSGLTKLLLVYTNASEGGSPSFNANSLSVTVVVK